MILDKAKMAHDYAIEMLKRGDPERRIAFDAWTLADAMQAEADKRNNKEPCDKNIGLDSSVLKPSNSMELEWQPDWSQAPEWAIWWAMDGFSNQANWYDSEPYIDGDSEIEIEWNIELKANMETYEKAPSFNYAGNWQDSLRKRPQRKRPQ